MLFSKEKRWPKQPDSDEVLAASARPRPLRAPSARRRRPHPPANARAPPPPQELESLTVVFVRHGESEWNDVFNKGFGPSFLVRLVGAPPPRHPRERMAGTRAGMRRWWPGRRGAAARQWRWYARR